MSAHEDADRVIAVLAALYQHILLREADRPGLELYAGLILKGEMTLPQALQSFLQSEEFKRNFDAFAARYAPSDDARAFRDVSQFGEIALLVRRIVNEASPSRLVVDVGVRGREGSNSFDLMRHFGWRGLLIEANPQLADGIAAEFAGLDFRLISTAVSDYSGEAVFHLGANDAISSLSEDAAAGWGPIRGQVRVPVRRLPDILAEHDVAVQFDLLSLDIEGEDIKVMNDLIDRSGYRPKWVIIEASYDFRTTALTDLPFSQQVVAAYEIVERTQANLLLRRR